MKTQTKNNTSAYLGHYKATTEDGRAFYFLTAEKARQFADKVGGSFHGKAPQAEISALISSALNT